MTSAEDRFTELDSIIDKGITGLLEQSHWDRGSSESDFTATPPGTDMPSPPTTAVDPLDLNRRSSDTSSVSKPSRENSPSELEFDMDAVKNMLDNRNQFKSKGMNVKVLGVAQKDARSRVETQIKLCIQLVSDNGNMVPYWQHLRIPESMLSSQERVRRSKALKGNLDEKTTLSLDAMVVCASEPERQVYTCQGCIQRERKRARRRDEVDDDEYDKQRIVIFNTNSLMPFGGDIILPTRITCYCRHHKELLGFAIYFMLRDSGGNLVATGLSPPILITDDHKAHAKMVAQARLDPNRSRKRQRIDDDLPTLKQEDRKRPTITDEPLFALSNDSQVHQLFQILQNQVASPRSDSTAAVPLPLEDVPNISKVVPGEGPLHGGVEITILGTGFQQGLTVLFGSTPATAVQFWNSNTLVCLLPPAAVAGPVLVTFQGLTSSFSESPAIFTYKDDSERALMEIALQIVGLRMSGKLEDAKQVAIRILGDTQDESGSSNTGMEYQARMLANAASNQLNLSSKALESLLLDAFTAYDVGPAHVMALNARGHSMLHLAVMCDMPRLTKWLAKRGGKVLLDCPDEKVGGWTALMWASFLGRQDCVNVLIQQGADGWCVDDQDRTAYELALEQDCKPIAALLDNTFGFGESGDDLDSEISDETEDGPAIVLANVEQPKEMQRVMHIHSSVDTDSESHPSYTERLWDFTDRIWNMDFKRKQDPASPTRTTTTSMQGLPIQLSVFSWAGQSSTRSQTASSDELTKDSVSHMFWLPVFMAIVAIFVFTMIPSKFENVLWDLINVHILGGTPNTKVGAAVGNHAWVPAA